MTFNNLSSLGAHLDTRRSGKPKLMDPPGPSPVQIARIVARAARTPDHGKLQPWRVVSIADDQRPLLAEALRRIFLAERGMAHRDELPAVQAFAQMAPTLLVVLHSPRESAKIPAWEQQLSTGAFTMNLLHAIHAEGFAGGWLTGWASSSPGVLALFGADHERIAGFVFAGTPSDPLEERPRPALGDVLSDWQPPQT